MLPGLHLVAQLGDKRGLLHGLVGEMLELVEDDLTVDNNKTFHGIGLHTVTVRGGISSSRSREEECSRRFNRQRDTGNNHTLFILRARAPPVLYLLGQECRCSVRLVGDSAHDVRKGQPRGTRLRVEQTQGEERDPGRPEDRLEPGHVLGGGAEGEGVDRSDHEGKGWGG